MSAKLAISPISEAATSLTTVFAGIRDGVVTLSADNTTIETVNPAALTMFGRTAEEMRGAAFRNFVPNPDALDGANHKDDGGEKRVVNTVGRQADGSEFPVELYTTWTPTADGAVLTVVMRPASSKPDRQRQARQRGGRQSQYERKFQELGRFADGISHDFNNLLVTILGYAGFLKDDLPNGSRERMYAEQVVAAGERGRDLVDRILAFSRRPTGDRQLVDLTRLIPDALGLIQSSLSETITLHGPNEPRPLHILGNETELVQALVNVCANAAASLRQSPGQIAVSLDTRATLDEAWPSGSQPDPFVGERRLRYNDPATADMYAIIAVTDTGTGIETELLDDIVEPYFTTKQHGLGTGLGLAAVRRIVAAHDGALIISSRPDHGTRVELAFPVAEASAGVQGRRATAEDRAAPSDAAAPSMNGSILVVDDEQDVGDVIVELLDRLGFDAVACNEPDTAFEAMTQSPDAWRAVLIDQAMPGKSGLEIVSEMRLSGITTPVILVSGNYPEAEPETLDALGIVGFIQKPIRSPDLNNLVKLTAPAL